jgi:ABC-2 type transport system ATP-binding protein/lipopolysaccharide transport system ATP-binding protein
LDLTPLAHLRSRAVSVDFPIYQASSRSLKKAVLARSTSGNLARDAFDRVLVQALRDISFDVEDGERLAIVGRNGAGKTTLLRVLAGILEPVSGRVARQGRVSALLDPLVGLDVHSTGRENIFLRGLYLGIRRREIETYLDEIVDFTELGQYIEMPVRAYSSGMIIRLAFAISTCVPTDILLMDEWLAAGDAHFLAKAQRRMSDYVRNAKILVLASHSMPLLEEWCRRAILLEEGRIVAMGAVGDVVEEYRKRDEARGIRPMA